MCLGRYDGLRAGSYSQKGIIEAIPRASVFGATIRTKGGGFATSRETNSARQKALAINAPCFLERNHEQQT